MANLRIDAQTANEQTVNQITKNKIDENVAKHKARKLVAENEKIHEFFLDICFEAIGRAIKNGKFEAIVPYNRLYILGVEKIKNYFKKESTFIHYEIVAICIKTLPSKLAGYDYCITQTKDIGDDGWYTSDITIQWEDAGVKDNG